MTTFCWKLLCLSESSLLRIWIVSMGQSHFSEVCSESTFNRAGKAYLLWNERLSHGAVTRKNSRRPRAGGEAKNTEIDKERQKHPAPLDSCFGSDAVTTVRRLASPPVAYFSSGSLGSSGGGEIRGDAGAQGRARLQLRQQHCEPVSPERSARYATAD